MIKWARTQLGSTYTWGGAGPYKLGYDCSGLVLQMLYVGGVNPTPINVLKHAEPTYRTSQQLAKHPGLKKVSRSKSRRGDILFWTDRGGTVRHCAVDLGDGRMIEALGTVRIVPIRTVYAFGSRRITSYVRRPFV